MNVINGTWWATTLALCLRSATRGGRAEMYRCPETNRIIVECFGSNDKWIKLRVAHDASEADNDPEPLMEVLDVRGYNETVGVTLSFETLTSVNSPHSLYAQHEPPTS